jgi:hypothetical protein
MKKKDKIIILKAKVIELERELKSAQRTCAKQDNEIDMLKETIRCHVENNQIVAQVLMDKNKSERESKYDDAIDSLDRAFKYGISKLLEENKENFLKSDVSSLTEKYNPTSSKALFDSYHKSGLHTPIEPRTTLKDNGHIPNPKEWDNHPIESTQKGVVINLYGQFVSQFDFGQVNYTDDLKEAIIFNNLEEFTSVWNIEPDKFRFIQVEESPFKKYEHSDPIESTQELFEGNGVIKTRDSLYFKKVDDKGFCCYTKDIEEAALFNSFEHFREQTKKPYWEAHPDNFTFIPLK